MSWWLRLVSMRPTSLVLGSTAVFGTYSLASLDDGAFSASTRERIFGGYNNRIRQLSSPEKIFHTFASHKGKNGQELMDWRDFRTAFLPYTFQAMEVYQKEVNPDPFLKKFTTTMIRSEEREMAGGSETSELMNFAEYSFMAALAGIPKHEFYLALKMFDADRSGYIEEDELEKVVELFRPNSMSAYTFKKVIQGSVAYQELLGDGKVSIDEMYNFLCKLREGILRLEFDQYDWEGKGSISSQDFAMSLVSYAHHKLVYQYVRRVKSCPDLGRVSLQEFLEFNEAILRLDEILDGLAFYFTAETKITPEVMQQAFYAATGKVLAINLMEILLHVVDKDKNGVVELSELSQLMSKRKVMNLMEQRDFGFVRTIGCLRDCFTEQIKL